MDEMIELLKEFEAKLDLTIKSMLDKGLCPTLMVNMMVDTMYQMANTKNTTHQQMFDYIEKRYKFNLNEDFGTDKAVSK